jgi:hypothetical protein
MKFVAQFILTVVFVILFFVGLFAGTLKFQLLDSNFWETSFEKHNTYELLASESKSVLEKQINKEGGSKNDARVLTDLITKENAKDFLDKNIENIISFANGKSNQLIAYIPVSILPKSLLPKNLIGIKDEIPLTDLLTKFNYQNAQNINLQGLKQTHKTSNLLFFGSITLLLVILILLVILVEAGGRLISPGIAILLSGVLTILISRIGNGLKTLSTSSLGETPPFGSILATNLLQPVAIEFTKSWLTVGVILVVAGISLFFIRKPS